MLILGETEIIWIFSEIFFILFIICLKSKKQISLNIYVSDKIGIQYTRLGSSIVKQVSLGQLR